MEDSLIREYIQTKLLPLEEDKWKMKSIKLKSGTYNKDDQGNWFDSAGNAISKDAMADILRKGANDERLKPPGKLKGKYIEKTIQLKSGVYYRDDIGNWYDRTGNKLEDNQMLRILKAAKLDYMKDHPEYGLGRKVRVGDQYLYKNGDVYRGSNGNTYTSADVRSILQGGQERAAAKNRRAKEVEKEKRRNNGKLVNPYNPEFPDELDTHGKFTDDEGIITCERDDSWGIQNPSFKQIQDMFTRYNGRLSYMVSSRGVVIISPFESWASDSTIIGEVGGKFGGIPSRSVGFLQRARGGRRQNLIIPGFQGNLAIDHFGYDRQIRDIRKVTDIVKVYLKNTFVLDPKVEEFLRVVQQAYNNDDRRSRFDFNDWKVKGYTPDIPSKKDKPIIVRNDRGVVLRGGNSMPWQKSSRGLNPVEDKLRREAEFRGVDLPDSEKSNYFSKSKKLKDYSEEGKKVLNILNQAWREKPQYRFQIDLLKEKLQEAENIGDAAAIQKLKSIALKIKNKK